MGDPSKRILKKGPKVGKTYAAQGKNHNFPAKLQQFVKGEGKKKDYKIKNVIPEKILREKGVFEKKKPIWTMGRLRIFCMMESHLVL